MAELARLVDFDWTELRGRCIAGEHLGATALLFASHARDDRGAPVAYAAQFDACSAHAHACSAHARVEDCGAECLTHEAWVFPADVWALDAGIAVPKPLPRAALEENA